MQHIAFAFLLPKVGIIRRTRITAVVSMPKTTVNKNSNLFFKKNKIGVSFNFIISSPTVYIILLKNSN